MIKKLSIKKVIILVVILMITSIVFIKTAQSVFEDKKVEQVISLTMSTTESGKLVLAETLNSWTGIYRVKSKLMFFEDDWAVKYFIGYKVLWYIDLLEKDALKISYNEDKEVKVIVSALIPYPPQVIPESFLILGEQRSWTLNEETMRVDLVNNLSNELSRVYKNLVNKEEAMIVAEDSLYKIVQQACLKSNLRYSKIIIEFKE